MSVPISFIRFVSISNVGWCLRCNVYQSCGVGGKMSDSWLRLSRISDTRPFKNFRLLNIKGNEVWPLKSMEIVVHGKKYLIQQKFQKKLHHFNRIPNLGRWCKKGSNWASGVGVGQKNPTPTPPKNIRLRRRNPDVHKTFWHCTIDQK